MHIVHHQPLQIGKYLVSAFAKPAADGRGYAPSVSIRRGRGAASHDSVLRFDASFDDHARACRFALEQGLLYLKGLGADAAQPSPAGDR